MTTVRIGHRSPREAARQLHLASEASRAADRAPKVPRTLQRLVRRQFATKVGATRALATKIRAAIDALRAGFWERSGLYHEAGSSTDDEDAFLRAYIAAADRMSPDELERALRDAYQEMYAAGVVHVRTELDVDFEFRPERALAALDAYGNDFAVGVVDAEREALKSLIREAFEQGLDIRELSAEIATHFEDGVHRIDADGNDRAIDLDAWAQLVARTETARAMNQGALDGYEAAGIERVIWVTADDERVCPICNALDGRTTSRGQVFPGTDVTAGPIHPQCRCGIVGLSDATRQLVRDDDEAA